MQRIVVQTKWQKIEREALSCLTSSPCQKLRYILSTLVQNNRQFNIDLKRRKVHTYTQREKKNQQQQQTSKAQDTFKQYTVVG